MKYDDYVMKNVRIGVVEEGKQNAGNRFIICDLFNADDEDEKRTTQIFWEDCLGTKIDDIASVFPKNGKDAKGNPWNGTNATIDPATFNPKEAEKALMNFGDEGRNRLLLPNGEYVQAQLDGPYCMKYITDLGEHKKNDWVLDAGGFIKIYRKIKLFIRHKKDGRDLGGWTIEERMQQRMRNMIPLAAAVKECPNLVDPRYLSDYIIPTVTPVTAPATAPTDDNVDEER